MLLISTSVLNATNLFSRTMSALTAGHTRAKKSFRWKRKNNLLMRMTLENA